MRTVVDASVALRWYLAEPGAEAADQILREAILGARELVAPDLILAEFANALWKKVRTGGCGEREASEILDMFLGDAPRLIDPAPLTERAFELAARLDESVYDCIYLAAAVEAGASLATADARLARRARSVLTEVELIA
jgi:predicted nucleic acid-binding protein